MNVKQCRFVKLDNKVHNVQKYIQTEVVILLRISNDSHVFCPGYWACKKPSPVFCFLQIKQYFLTNKGLKCLYSFCLLIPTNYDILLTKAIFKKSNPLWKRSPVFSDSALNSEKFLKKNKTPGGVLLQESMAWRLEK